MNVETFKSYIYLAITLVLSALAINKFGIDLESPYLLIPLLIIPAGIVYSQIAKAAKEV